jgi:multiple sugar transport system substrate-binding protein
MKKLLAMVLALMMVFALASAAIAETVELDFWTVFTGEDGVNMDQLVANFNTANPGIKVNHMKMDAADLYTKAPLAVTTGEGVPDVAIIHAERIAQFVKDGALLPFTDVLANGDFAAEQYLSAGWDLGEIDGTRYSLPLDVHSWVCYVNLDLLATYDLEPPLPAVDVLSAGRQADRGWRYRHCEQ